MSALAADAAFLEKAGTPVAAIGGEALARTVGLAMARSHGYKSYPFITLPLYLGASMTDEDLERYADLAFVQLERVLSSAPGVVQDKEDGRGAAKTAATVYEFASENDAQEQFFERGWTDGLPIVPPTRDRVTAFLQAVRLEPDQIVMEYQPRARRVTAEKIAVNAVMAGCKPEYMPYVVAACKAVTAEEFALNHLASLSSPFPLLIVNGPRARELGFNSGMYVFGPGNRPNATVGRALSLILQNCFDAKVGGIQRGTMGNAARWGFCIAENESTPWPPLHVERGFSAEDDVVTVFPAGNPPIWFGTTNALSAEDAAQRMESTLTHSGPSLTYYLFVLSPPFQEQFLKDGWSKDDIRRYLFDHVAETVAELKRRGRWQYFGTPDGQPPRIEPGDEERLVHLLKRDQYRQDLWQEAELSREPEILIVVAGGDAGRTAAIVHSYNVGTRPVSRRVEFPG